MKSLSIFLLLSALSTAAFAQKPASGYDPVSGELQLKGGVGNIDPLDAKLQLTLRGHRFYLKPYIGVNVVTKDASANLEDLHYLYTSTKDLYDSRLETWSKGQNYLYGFSGGYVFNPMAHLTFSLEGNYSNLHGYGNRTESLVNYFSSASYTPFRTNLDKPTESVNNLKANVVYNLRLRDIVSTIRLVGNFSREANDDESLQTVISGQGVYPFQENYLHINNVTSTFSLVADYQRLFDHGQTLSAGIRYQHREIHSDNLQVIKDFNDDNQQLFNKSSLDVRFLHEMNEASFYAGYKLVGSRGLVNALLEYVYTDMNGKNLHDLVPSFNAVLHLTKHQDLSLVYGMRLVRPEAKLLNPTHIQGAFTLEYGNPDLQYLHANNLMLSHTYKNKVVKYSTTLQHVFANDGFNAMWMIKDGLRIATWGNEGIRRQWSLTPEVTYTPTPKTTLDAKLVVMWDKRIAEAIDMAKEHWGVTTHLGIKQQLPARFRVNAHFDYSEGNTIDLYSHAGRSLSFGGELQRSFLPSDRLNLTLSYSNTEYAKTILTQGVEIPVRGFTGYTGEVYSRPKHRYVLSLALNWKF